MSNIEYHADFYDCSNMKDLRELLSHKASNGWKIENVQYIGDTPKTFSNRGPAEMRFFIAMKIEH